jgi:protein phosphatase
MALKIVEHAGLTDVGRQREANEDNYVVVPPVFVVADGMGGARAGEVASRTAAEAFEEAGADGQGTPEERLTRLTREANRRIYDLAQSDTSRRGMGTTLTAAMLSEAGVSLGHVGDSRAYRLREGQLEQLTHDHSLVAELERSGQLTAEAAEHHPQRSIITRALGPEADVQVDAHTHAARPGDVYLLCSDGLTSMISNDEIGSILRGGSSLEEGSRELVRAANQSGGRDNITVVLFRIGADGEEPVGQDTLAGSETIAGGLTAADVEEAVRDQERADAKAPTTTAATAAPGHGAAAPRRGGQQRGRRRGVRRALGVLTTLLVLAAIGVGLWLGARSVYFLGTDDGGLVTVYRGVPYELPLGIDLYSTEYVSSVPALTIGERRRERLLDHEWRSRTDAEDLMRQLERGTLDLGRIEGGGAAP